MKRTIKQMKKTLMSPDSITEQAMFSATLSSPNALNLQSLTEAGNNKGGWLYDRRFGLFLCDTGMHQISMCFLMGLEHGPDNDFRYDVSGILDTNNHWNPSIDRFAWLADKYMESTKGSVFRSSVCKTPKAWSSKHLNDLERDFFGSVEYLSNKQRGS